MKKKMALCWSRFLSPRLGPGANPLLAGPWEVWVTLGEDQRSVLFFFFALTFCFSIGSTAMLERTELASQEI